MLLAVLATISQETLAEMIGTTRSRVNLFMNKFKPWLHQVQRETFHRGISLTATMNVTYLSVRVAFY